MKNKHHILLLAAVATMKNTCSAILIPLLPFPFCESEEKAKLIGDR